MHLQHVLRLNNKTPSCPNRTSCHQCQVLGQRELVSRSEEIAGAGEDNTPFHYWCPVHAHKLAISAASNKTSTSLLQLFAMLVCCKSVVVDPPIDSS